MSFVRDTTPTVDNAFSNFRLYNYTPSLQAASLFTALFLLATVWQFHRAARARTWFMIPFCLGGVFEAAGYISRIISSREAPDYALEPYILQTTLLLVAPALFAASVYMNLDKIVQLVDGEEHLIIRRRWLTPIFVSGDMLAFVLQGTGAGLISSKAPTLTTTGKTLALVGLVLQTFYFTLFVLAAAIFDIRIRACSTTKSIHHYRWRQKHMVCLYVVSVLIFARSVVRIVEFAEGFEGYLVSHEVYLYVFDAVLMFVVMVVLGWVHPGEVVAGIREERGSRRSLSS
ncbi:hypothetical protein M409DRAFT_29797 [Zasmidium cellare ATCC 36951]|uniref:RTA1 like protein n=1 Tax=Zasmidium cellare ATCC 36951 TaxID=1080233 RepID=A0A6A6C0K4_ZASCE|nr:uncharacterized protein M409DRAFT_29797 [Zasmidium cellare ATCC 36951]KAF2159798.1 hypothetical protein M409DRAFT_29797 [Zasmidium cellare ATCC 36951]